MKQIVTSVLYLLAIFSVSRFVFVPTNLYYELKWLDIPMHIMGGFGVASLVSAVLAYFGKRVSFWHLFSVYTVVAIAWECYEFVNDITSYQEWNGWIDTSKDYLNGLLGTVLAYLFIRK